MPFHSSPLINAGFEFNISALSLRAGYRLPMGAADGDVDGGLTAGAGFKAGVLSLDYAFVPYGSLSTVHRLQVTLALPGDFFQAKIVGPDSSSVTAQSFYNNAQRLEQVGETLKALIQYQRCEESYPEYLKASPQPFYLTAMKKLVELQAVLDSHGDSGQIQKFTKEHLTMAKEDINGGHFKEAIGQLQQASMIDPSNPLILSA